MLRRGQDHVATAADATAAVDQDLRLDGDGGGGGPRLGVGVALAVGDAALRGAAQDLLLLLLLLSNRGRGRSDAVMPQWMRVWEVLRCLRRDALLVVCHVVMVASIVMLVLVVGMMVVVAVHSVVVGGVAVLHRRRRWRKDDRGRLEVDLDAAPLERGIPRAAVAAVVAARGRAPLLGGRLRRLTVAWCFGERVHSKFDVIPSRPVRAAVRVLGMGLFRTAVPVVTATIAPVSRPQLLVTIAGIGLLMVVGVVIVVVVQPLVGSLGPVLLPRRVILVA